MTTFLNRLFTPMQLLTIGFAVLILLGAFLLMLPISTTNYVSQSFVDALFTSTSAVSTTGLAVEDTGTYYSLFGQIIILTLIQIGGLGYMVLFVMITLVLKSKLSIIGKKYLRESVSSLPKVDMIRFVKLTIYFTLFFEVLGTILYLVVWASDFSFFDALYFSLFHSVSAFCTAGFSLFPDNLSAYGTNWLINFNTYILIITGSIGFFVLYDVLHYLKTLFRGDFIRRITLHSKIVLVTSLVIYVVPTIMIFFIEYGKFSNNFIDQILFSTFQSLSASTTVGFNTIDIGSMADSSLFILTILMIIGASPGSTAGGIKTTSLIVFSKFSLAALRDSDTISIFKRSINYSFFKKASAQIFIAILAVIFFTVLLTISERMDFIKIVFEAASAFGTVGLSAGITAKLSSFGKIYLIALMLIGRVGPLVIGLSLIPKTNKINYTYPEEEILIS